jgi:hypothetical protein
MTSRTTKAAVGTMIEGNNREAAHSINWDAILPAMDQESILPEGAYCA